MKFFENDEKLRYIDKNYLENDWFKDKFVFEINKLVNERLGIQAQYVDLYGRREAYYLLNIREMKYLSLYPENDPVVCWQRNMVNYVTDTKNALSLENHFSHVEGTLEDGLWDIEAVIQDYYDDWDPGYTVYADEYVHYHLGVIDCFLRLEL